MKTDNRVAPLGGSRLYLFRRMTERADSLREAACRVGPTSEELCSLQREERLLFAAFRERSIFGRKLVRARLERVRAIRARVELAYDELCAANDRYLTALERAAAIAEGG